MIFYNAKLILPDCIIPSGWVEVKGGIFTDMGESEPFAAVDCQIDCKGGFLSPGFIDIHTHGAGGYDFMDGTEEAFVKASQTHMRHGTTTLLPTTLTSSNEDLFDTMCAFRKIKDRDNMPNLPGLHLEGPYFNVAQKGAQNEKYIRQPERSNYLDIIKKAEGCILRWSVAPELPGALEMGKELSKMGIVMSIGHSDCTYPDVVKAVQNGYRHITHFYSGMSGVKRVRGKRLLGLIECGYLMDDLTIEIIADGMHLPPELLSLILKCKDNNSISLVTDSMRGAGMPPGYYILGSLRDGQEVIVEDGVAKLPDRSAYAGSVATADRLVRVMTEQVGLPLYSAVKMLSLNPARVIGLDQKKGSIEIGKDADFLIFDDQINIKEVYVCGEKRCL
ncbi:MAG: N-acetylglucosamine-6-phosphate deacetylase [Clostridiales bacterium]|nr:N-acetylglucosamine-6-phosphate deacetylase [Clostridiales bacterium]